MQLNDNDREPHFEAKSDVRNSNYLYCSPRLAKKKRIKELKAKRITFSRWSNLWLVLCILHIRDFISHTLNFSKLYRYRFRIQKKRMELQ